ncbi:MAG: 50S ribosomal protein L18 [Candidatus Levybacteria bacterium]|nr:50S ribosomal protein L18 [Candidatus Levybacteria bacterium]
MGKKERKRNVRTKSEIKGTEGRPRLSVFRSNRYIYAQLIDDEKGKTILGISEKNLDKNISGESNQRINRARQLGTSLAKEAVGRKIKNVVFDRRSYSYHGVIKALAEGAREGGLKF